MRCPACGTENREGRKFCTECGSSLSNACPSCGAPLTGGEKFCGECGAAVPATATIQAFPRATPPQAPPAAERRLVSVLFADLVGFTTLSEARDAEEVRELLSRYFDSCRTLIARYGGVVEKFIGDAVMAVWGTPVATEDDAERAVRAALDLTSAVAALGEEEGVPALKARAGVLTGEAAVNVGAEGQGMVAGDLVNTASRIQSAAQPGTVLVGEATRRASEAAIVYEDAGTHELKGKAEPVPLWRAVRVVAGARGELTSVGLEAPFVGRDREMRLIKQLFHGSADERAAHLVSVVGVAGTGKSRIAWEFEKYIDGLADTISWHRGRCLPYGEGVTYWALAEMVKMRARIAEGEDPSSAAVKLRAVLDERVPDLEERAWIEPRLSHLLGLEDRVAGDREDLFAAWRLFFERLSDIRPTVLVFEDLHWADASLLDFVEYLMDWARDKRLFVLTLARPELLDRRPHWGAGPRNFSSMYLEPLAAPMMEELLRGVAPGLPEDLRGKILERAAGVPLYAVETVRMLLDRGLLVREGNVYRPTGSIETLEVPETLHALIAARLDGLTAEERRIAQDASVLGKTFRVPGLSALTALPEVEVEAHLASLVRKEVFFLQADPRSPERGQYSFVQDLLMKVAYDTMSKRERKALHLAAADFIQATWGAEEDEFVEVVASHYLHANEAAPDAEDAREIREKARRTLVLAAERASSLAASGEAQRYFEQAAELTEEDLVRADLFEQAGEMAARGARLQQAKSHLQAAISLFKEGGSTHAVARVSARLAEVEWAAGRQEEALQPMEEAFRVLAHDEPDEDLATLAAQLGRFYTLLGRLEEATPKLEVALETAEALDLPGVLSQALNSKGIVALYRGRLHEGIALFKHALEIALEGDIPVAAFRAYNNVGEVLGRRDRYEEAAAYLRSGLALARRVGNRVWEWSFIGELAYTLWALGDWDEALREAEAIPDDNLAATSGAALSALPYILLARGLHEEAERMVALYSRFEADADQEVRVAYKAAHAAVLRATGRSSMALVSARAAFDASAEVGTGSQGVKEGFVQAGEAAFESGELATVEELIGVVAGFPGGRLTPFLAAQAARFRGRLAITRGQDDVEAGFKEAGGAFREHGMRFWLAVTLGEHGTWLAQQGRSEDAKSLLDEARQIFERLEAKPWLERLEGSPVSRPTPDAIGP